MYKENYGNIPNQDKINYLLEEAYNKTKDIKLLIKLHKMSKFLYNISDAIKLDKDISRSLCLYKLNLLSNEDIELTYQKLRQESFFFNAKILLVFDNSNFLIEYKKYHDLNEYEKLIIQVDKIFDDDANLIKNFEYEKLNSLLPRDIDSYLPKIDNTKFPYKLKEDN